MKSRGKTAKLWSKLAIFIIRLYSIVYSYHCGVAELCCRGKTNLPQNAEVGQFVLLRTEFAEDKL